MFEVVAVDALDEASAEALDRIRAGAPLPLPATDIRLDGVGERSRKVTCVVAREHVLTRSEQAETGDDGMRATCELAEHGRRVLRARGLPVDTAVEDDGRIDAQRDPASACTERALPSA